jgi:hypothetical protein
LTFNKVNSTFDYEKQRTERERKPCLEIPQVVNDYCCRLRFRPFFGGRLCVFLHHIFNYRSMKKRVTAKSVKDKIREKFGTVTNFLRISGVDQLEFHKACMPFYATKPEYKKILAEASVLCDTLDVTPADNDFTDALLSVLKASIDEFGGVEVFCEQNPQFSMVSVYQILAGRRKKISPVVRDLLNHFEIKK